MVLVEVVTTVVDYGDGGGGGVVMVVVKVGTRERILAVWSTKP